MTWLIRATVAMLGLLAVCILAMCVWFANEWVVSTFATVTLLAWLAGWLVVAYRKEQVRAGALGALVAGGAYWLLVLGPWFSVNIGPTLLTSRLLTWADAKRTQTPAQTTYSTSTLTAIDYSTGVPVQSGNVLVGGSGYVTTMPQLILSTPQPQPQPPQNPSPLQLAGQWAFCWLFAVAGGGFAWLIGWRSSSTSKSKGSRPQDKPAEAKP